MAKSRSKPKKPPSAETHRHSASVERPKYLTVIGILILIFFGAFGIIGFVLNVVLASFMPSSYHLAVQLYGAPYYFFTVAISAITSFIWLIASVGVIQSHNWSRKLTAAISATSIVVGIASSAVGLFLALPNLDMGGELSFGPAVLGGIIVGLAVGLLIQGLILWYFTRADIKAYYKSIGEAD